MVIIADLHLHSKYSKATSSQLNFDNLVKYARMKGIDLLGTGDFTHPEQMNNIRRMKEKMGVYYFNNFPFIISGEISLIYNHHKPRKVHLIVLVPNLMIADKINSFLDGLGRRDYDGRPIFGISCEKFTEEMMKISNEIEIIPAHIWTPWFGVFGSKSGFDSLKDAFGNQVNNIHAIETGLSSDPLMNWRLSQLDNLTILSFSDSHSFWPWRLGREATIFDVDNNSISYSRIIKSIRENNLIGTIEVDPAYGIYHYDGHRNCNFSCSPEETKRLNGICPVCKEPLTIGVDYRVNELADRPVGFVRENAKKFYKILPLHEVISLFTETGLNSKVNWELYYELINNFDNELNVLINVEKNKFYEKKINPRLIDLIIKNREGKIKIRPGYDGKYGEAILEEQTKLF
ncbi:MAG: endonuclease Q family protein [Candidatus Pacearchaeota archaeon]